jgi:hypothetical protein
MRQQRMQVRMIESMVDERCWSAGQRFGYHFVVPRQWLLQAPIIGLRVGTELLCRGLVGCPILGLVVIVIIVVVIVIIIIHLHYLMVMTT